MDFERELILEEIEKYVEPQPRVPPERFVKNNDRSASIRKQGNEVFCKKNHAKSESHVSIWELYCKCIAFAEENSEQLASGYTNRAEFLMHINKYEESILDIDRALQITTSNELKIKLLCRRAESSVALQNGEQRNSLDKAKSYLDQIDDPSMNKSLTKRIKKAENILNENTLRAENRIRTPDFKDPDNAVNITYDKNLGRGLVAARDFHFGEFVCMEKFYATSFNSKRFYSYCSHCLAISWTVIPCKKCAYYMYCSEKCRDDAWLQYHEIECCINISIDSYIDYYTQMSLRCLIRGIHEAGSIKKLQAMVQEIDECTDKKTKGFSKNGEFRSDSFRSVYSLCSSSRQKQLESCPNTSITTAIALAKYTSVFGKQYENIDHRSLIENNDILFVAILLLRLKFMLRLNAFNTVDPSFDCPGRLEQIICAYNFCCPRGISFSPLVSLINHSCDPNVYKFFTNNGSVVYYAVKPISKGTQLFSSYYVSYERVIKMKRKSLLNLLFEFNCNCIACTKDYPVSSSPVTLQVDRLMNSQHFQAAHATLKKYSDIMVNNERPYRQFNQETINEFTKDVHKLLKKVDRHAFIFYSFTVALLGMIEGTYGTRLRVPHECSM